MPGSIFIRVLVLSAPLANGRLKTIINSVSVCEYHQCCNCPHGWLAYEQSTNYIGVCTRHLTEAPRSHWFAGTRRNFTVDKSRFRSGNLDCNNSDSMYSIVTQHIHYILVCALISLRLWSRVILMWRVIAMRLFVFLPLLLLLLCYMSRNKKNIPCACSVCILRTLTVPFFLMSDYNDCGYLTLQCYFIIMLYDGKLLKCERESATTQNMTRTCSGGYNLTKSMVLFSQVQKMKSFAIFARSTV